ncbi:MAG TPA: ribonuclease HII [Candidatus Portnoybacteria bacterium]|nr:ribonuclease HII [Candidatus Portnoybacteria bacterium]
MAEKQKTLIPNLNYETKLWQQGYNFVVGLDEVGRGPLAGPVCAAAVALNRKIEVQKIKQNQNIKDSKKFSAKQREEWYQILTTHADIKWGVGLVSEKIIDQINILEATKLAMKRALEELEKKGGAAEYLLLDGNFLLEDVSLSQKAVIRGDAKIWSCAAASIIAKVTRDRLMQKYHQQYPQYGFDKHKGYGTREHLKALKGCGVCAIHRQSFAPCKKK